MPDDLAARTRSLNLKGLLGTACLWAVGISFFLPDIVFYPFRAFTGGPHGVYGTWTGIVRTTPSERRGTPMTRDAQDTAASTDNSSAPAPSFAVVKLTVRPPLFSTLPHFFWRPSQELVGSVDVYLSDGTHQHCVHQLGGFPAPGQLQLLIYNPAKDMDAIAEAALSPAGLQFTSAMCPVRQGASIGFAGTLTRGSSAQVASLRAQLPATIAHAREQVAAEDANFAREWFGNVSVYNPDHRPAGNPPNAVMHLQFVPVPGSPDRFTGQGEFHRPRDFAESLTFSSVTLHDGAFEAYATFHDAADEFSIYSGSGSLSGTVRGDTLTIGQGGRMLLSINGTLHPSSAAPSSASR